MASLRIVDPTQETDKPDLEVWLEPCRGGVTLMCRIRGRCDTYTLLRLTNEGLFRPTGLPSKVGDAGGIPLKSDGRVLESFIQEEK